MLAEKKVLVLNRSWAAIGVITLEKALQKVFATYSDGTPKARIIDCVQDFKMMSWDDWSKIKPAENEEGIHTVNAIFRIPEIIIYTRYDKLPQQKVHYNRRQIYHRDSNKCQYCGKRKPGNELSLDHVVPRCQGGKSVWENVVVACVDCNSKKAGRTPKEANMKLLRDPKKPPYNFYTGNKRIKSWDQFLSEAYFNVELENDN